MKMMKIKGITKDFIIEPGKIYNVDIENPSYYAKIINAIEEADNDFFVYSDNYTPIDYSKVSVVISDLLNISPNNKKITTAFYKKIIDKVDKSVLKEQTEYINEKILNFLNDISKELDVRVDYDSEIDISKLLTMYKFCFNEENINVLEKIITFIKANLEIMNISFIITLNILPSLSEKDTMMLQKELEILNISLININCVEKNRKSIVEYTIIDEDLCEI